MTTSEEVSSLELICLSVVASVSAVDTVTTNKAKRSCGTKPFNLMRNEESHVFKLLIRLDDFQGFRSYLRIDARQFEYILSMVEHHFFKQDTVLRTAIPTDTRLAITLRFLASGESFRSLAFQFKVSHSTISQMIPEVMQGLISSLKDIYLNVPGSTDEWLLISNEFFDKWQYPNVIGTLDGKHIQLVSPSNSGSYFYNYKGTFSIVLMAIVDAHGKFLMVDIGCNGRVSDGGIWQNTLAHYFETNILQIPPPRILPNSSTENNFVLLADEAFPLKEYLMKPFPARTLDAAKRYYNYRHSRCRMTVECAFGSLAGRWRVFRSPLNLEPEKAELVVWTAIILHNFLIDNSSVDVVENTEEMREELLNSSFLALESTSNRHGNTRAYEVREIFCNFFNEQST